MSPAELPFLGIAELRAGFRRGDFTPLDALNALLARIDRVDREIHAYLSFDAAAARKAAQAADLALPLGGVPIGLKDVISAAGQPCGCASRILSGYVAPYDATAVARLRAAGAIPFGRLNMDEFAMGSSTENSSRGPTRNPWDPTRVPGGSSGGSAAAVAAHTAFASLGSDTGGSVRQPAALCGCVGFKPSYGRVSRYGLVAYGSSLDQIGPVTKSVADAAALLQAMAGADPHDSSTLPAPVPDYLGALASARDLRGVRLGLPKEYFVAGIAPAVEQAVRRAVGHCEQLGAEIVEVSLPHTPQALAVYYIIATAEASANLARFDGVRYGRRTEKPDGLRDQYERSRAEGFGPEVKRRIILGSYVLSSGYYDAYYLRAQKVRTLLRRDFAAAFEKVDAIVCPTTPDVAFRLGEKSDDPLAMYLSDVFSVAANLTGGCGLSVPCGFDETTAPGRALPIGLQFLAPALAEERLLRIGHVYEQATSWHLRRALP
ncbi:MAG: Asp-tRNA(Asn)/Glu-tRNA(Gln) amidotransferase subunit GatA [Verrucomicrobia bacterium]|nr:Asp-tRNA(Asn)/Glu-tRNA(Gln) amidotransferase subunit GatA [Verrucomicrobiota bacterium]